MNNTTAALPTFIPRRTKLTCIAIALAPALASLSAQAQADCVVSLHASCSRDFFVLTDCFSTVASVASASEEAALYETTVGCIGPGDPRRAVRSFRYLRTSHTRRRRSRRVGRRAARRHRGSVQPEPD